MVVLSVIPVRLTRGIKRPLSDASISSSDPFAGVVVPIPTCACETNEKNNAILNMKIFSGSNFILI